jgi:hypothetical protein
LARACASLSPPATTDGARAPVISAPPFGRGSIPVGSGAR